MAYCHNTVGINCFDGLPIWKIQSPYLHMLHWKLGMSSPECQTKKMQTYSIDPIATHLCNVVITHIKLSCIKHEHLFNTTRVQMLHTFE